MSNQKQIDLDFLRQMLQSAERSIQSAMRLLDDKKELTSAEIKQLEKRDNEFKKKAKKLSILEKDKIIEGVFDGQNMIGPDEKQYPIPANYASKSKLVEGDVLKLTIAADGTFMYKQIGPIERKKIIGTIIKEDGEMKVNAENKKYKVLTASLTYFKAEEGDQVTIIVPKDKESTWAAVENVIKKSNGDVAKLDDDLDI
ncbi:MAG: hypothetical protein PHN19_00480 [Patescibacteria group bacterium]|nr:hypothetical protein [Patescibacteria group bacterium]